MHTHTHTLVCVHTCNTGEILMSSVYLRTVNALVVISCPSRRLPPWGHWGQGARALLHCCQSWSINRRTHHLLIIIPLCTFCEFCESVTLSQLKVKKKRARKKRKVTLANKTQFRPGGDTAGDRCDCWQEPCGDGATGRVV